MSEWKVMETTRLGYAAARVIDESQPLHGSNIEVDNLFETKGEAMKRASDLNAKEEGGKIVRERKSEHLQLLIRPTTKAKLKQASEESGLSMNALANQILEEYLA